MMRDLGPFWALLETNFPLGGPRKHLAELVGADVLARLEQAGIVTCLRASETYPCPSAGGDNCPRQVVEHDDGSIVATCANVPANCSDVKLAPQDVEFLAVGPDGLFRAVRKALSLGGRTEELQGLRHAFRVGTFVPEPGTKHPVYFLARACARDYAEAVDALRSRNDNAPFALLLPTDRFVSEELQRQMRTIGIPLLPLSGVLEIDAAGAMVSRSPAEKFLSGIGQRVAGDVAPIVARVRRHDGWTDLTETAYEALIRSADQYDIFANERTRTVVRRNGAQRERAEQVRSFAFRWVRAAAECPTDFDPAAADVGDDDPADAKATFQRARQALDIKHVDSDGKADWTLLKTRHVGKRAVYRFSPDPDTTFALIFIPRL